MVRVDPTVGMHQLEPEFVPAGLELIDPPTIEWLQLVAVATEVVDTNLGDLGPQKCLGEEELGVGDRQGLIRV